MTTKRVFKYPQNGDILSLIGKGDEFYIDMPHNSRVLTVQFQGGKAFIWALIDPEANMSPRKFRLAGTGHPIEHADALTYVGTFQMSGGMLVFHLFTED